MSATARFYSGFTLALVLVIALSFYVGYRAGYAHAHASGAHHAVALRPLSP